MIGAQLIVAIALAGQVPYYTTPVYIDSYPVVIQPTLSILDICPTEHQILLNHGTVRSKFYVPVRFPDGYRTNIPVINGVLPLATNTRCASTLTIQLDYSRGVCYNNDHVKMRVIPYYTYDTLTTPPMCRPKPKPKPLPATQGVPTLAPAKNQPTPAPARTQPVPAPQPKLVPVPPVRDVVPERAKPEQEVKPLPYKDDDELKPLPYKDPLPDYELQLKEMREEMQKLREEMERRNNVAQPTDPNGPNVVPMQEKEQHPMRSLDIEELRREDSPWVVPIPGDSPRM